MKIKRFEASNMSDALRLIKKEFGEDAVILSAKSMKKKSRLLGNSNANQVVVTAAIDKASDLQMDREPDDNLDMTGQSQAGIGKSSRDDDGGLKFLKRFKPITRTGQRKLQPKLVRMMSKNETHSPNETVVLDKLLRSQGVDQSLADDLHQKASALIGPSQDAVNELKSALSQIISACGVVGTAGAVTNDARRIMVLIGAAGVGKTTTAAKFAAKHAMQFGGQSVALLSLDDQRIAGLAELERYAQIIGLELRSAFQVEELKRELDALRHHRLIIVDTPGLAADDHSQLESLRKLIKTIPGAVVSLVLNADADSAAMAKAVRFFKPLAPESLIYTKLDWGSRFGGLINIPLTSGMPISHLCDSPKVPEGMQIATSEKISELVLPDQVKSSAQQQDESVVTVVRGAEAHKTDHNYVANRNSDIFHNKHCKALKRINKDNMVMFKDPAEAMGQKFKPCRMCCSELIISKPVQRLARNYASYR